MSRGISFSTADYKAQYDPIFKDTDYWDTYQSILHQYKDAPSSNWWRQLTGKAQSDLYNHKQAFSNALNALVEQKRSDEYNSESSQVERMQEAGLNPDLLGTGNASQTDGADLPTQEPMQFENPVPHMVSFLSMIGSAVTGSQAMISQKIVNDGLRLQNLKTADDIVLGELGRMNLDPLGADIMPAFKLGFSTGSRSMDKKLESRAHALYDSISHKISSKTYEKNLADVRKGLYDIKSSAGYSDDDDFYSKLAEKMADAYQKIIEIENRTKTKGFSVQNKRLDNESEYLENFDPVQQANTENESNKRSYNKDKQWNEFISIQKGIIGFIRNQAKKGDTAAIDLIFRIFGENVDTNDNLSAIHQSNSSGLGTIANWFK